MMTWAVSPDCILQQNRSLIGKQNQNRCCNQYINKMLPAGFKKKDGQQQVKRNPCKPIADQYHHFINKFVSRMIYGKKNFEINGFYEVKHFSGLPDKFSY